jgi:hypothetical protein
MDGTRYNVCEATSEMLTGNNVLKLCLLSQLVVVGAPRVKISKSE